jgi:hypothetical protein
VEETLISEYARQLMEAHGQSAIAEAAQRAAACERHKDKEGAQTWRRVEAALQALRGRARADATEPLPACGSAMRRPGRRRAHDAARPGFRKPSASLHLSGRHWLSDATDLIWTGEASSVAGRPDVAVAPAMAGRSQWSGLRWPFTAGSCRWNSRKPSGCWRRGSVSRDRERGPG